jgi:acetyl esterase/lipase
MVSWLFLIVALWGASWTVISYRPPHRPPVIMGIGFFAAWSTTELAPVHILWQFVGVAVFVWFGALESWVGWVALAITLVSWIALAVSVKGSLQTEQVFVDALRRGLGDGWDRNLEPGLRASSRHVSWTRILLPFRFKRAGVRRTKNIQYVDDGSRRHRLDVYRHKGTRATAPVLLQIHGGGWMIGNKDQQGLPLMYHLASQGWVCVAINYRLSPKATWPDHLVDCKRALAWIREHISEYGGDPEYVVVTGGSAGGHLTAMMGLTANDPQYQPGFEDADTTVRAMIPFYGVFDWTGSTNKRDNGLREALERYIVKKPLDEARDVYISASPMFRITEDAPRALIVHGDLDTLAPIEQARAFVDRLRDISRRDVVYVELRGAHHAFEVFNSIRTMHAIAGVSLYLSWLRSVDRPGSRSGDAAGPRDSAATELPATGPKSTVRTER